MLATMKKPKRKYISRSRGVSNLHGHLIITTKYRRDLMTETMLKRLGELVQKSCDNWQCELIESNGEPNHYHILFRYFPQITLSKFIGNLKSTTSRAMRKEFPTEVNRLLWGGEFWNESYSIDAVANVKLETLKQYVKNQPKELLAEVTARHGFEF